MKDYLKIGVIVFTLVAVVALVGAIIGNNLLAGNNQEENLGAITEYGIDVVGTKTGTSTVGVGFGNTSYTAGQSATSTYPKKVGFATDEVTFSFRVINASSTNNMQFSFLGSYDDECDTSTTTTIYSDVVTTGQINWYDIGRHIVDYTYASPFSNGTTTFRYADATVDEGKTLTLTNLDYNCVALQASGSSTEAWVQMRRK